MRFQPNLSIPRLPRRSLQMRQEQPPQPLSPPSWRYDQPMHDRPCGLFRAAHGQSHAANQLVPTVTLPMFSQPHPLRSPPPAIQELTEKISLGPSSHANRLARKRSIAQCQPRADVVMLERANHNAVNRSQVWSSIKTLCHLNDCRHTFAAGSIESNPSTI